MSCAKKCLTRKGDLAHKTKHGKVQSVFSDSSHIHNAVAEKSTETHSIIVDKSAFSSQRKSIQYLDILPKSTADHVASKDSPSKDLPTAGKRKFRTFSEPKTKDKIIYSSLKKKSVSSTADKQEGSYCEQTKPKTTPSKGRAVSSAAGKQEVTQLSNKATTSEHSHHLSATDPQKFSRQTCRTEFLPESVKQKTQTTVLTGSKTKSNLSSEPEATRGAKKEPCSTKSSDNHSKSDEKTTFDNTVSNKLSNLASSCGSVNVSFSSSRCIELNSNPTSIDNRTADKWSEQKKRISHFANLSIARQVRKRYLDSSDPKSKKAKLS